jgi:acetylglutamate kinase
MSRDGGHPVTVGAVAAAAMPSRRAITDRPLLRTTTTEARSDKAPFVRAGGSLKGAATLVPLRRLFERPLSMNISPHDIARVLSEALPHMQRYDEEIVVVKYGGHAMGEEDLARSFARDIVLMEQTAINPVVVHGGGPQIGEMLKRLGIKSQFAGGLRITDAATIEIVEMVLGGSINKQIVGFINAAGGKAVGLCGKDGNMVVARKASRRVVDADSNIEKIIDLGFVGEPEKVDVTVLNQILGRDLIPVLAPLATSTEGLTYNVNADTFAGAIAGALKAKRLLLLTDVPGVLDKSKNLIKQLSTDEARALIADGTISGGMIPKVETCIYALEAGVEGVVILDGKVPHAVLLELLTDHGAGTLMTR